MFWKLTFSCSSRHCVGHWSNPLGALTSAFPCTKFPSQQEIWIHYERELSFQNWVPYVFLGDKVDICIHWKYISQVILVLILKGGTCSWLKSKHWQVAAMGSCRFSLSASSRRCKAVMPWNFETDNRQRGKGKLGFLLSLLCLSWLTLLA